ncbi:FAD linked oxidase [Macrophomina phaseolina MS6]|uniref:FAD linked oxidase n=1 Tax=Macrophomina phaseolina (strain MS6) TaxID=1126212 RepID=K2RBT2_MACPH|nr:FAD linked oxidase [Macrophomina phaseolina MS6]
MQFRGSAVVLSLFLLTSPVSASPVAEACNVLASAFPEQVYVSGTSAYDAENNDYWSTSAVLVPACIFAPGNAAEVSHAVNTLTAFRAPFAVKGGGGMTVDGYANIDKGIVISLVNLTSVEVSDDLSLIKFGAGNNWDAVYAALKPYNRTTVGGRMGLVGVSGYLLGGGVGFLSNQYGFAATSVAEYEVSEPSI